VTVRATFRLLGIRVRYDADVRDVAFPWGGRSRKGGGQMTHIRATTTTPPLRAATFLASIFPSTCCARDTRAGLHSRDMRNCSWRHFHTSLLRHVVYGGAPTALGAAGVSPYEKFMPRYTLTAAVAGSVSTTFHDRPTTSCMHRHSSLSTRRLHFTAGCTTGCTTGCRV